jgi:predicted transcriptional regulator
MSLAKMTLHLPPEQYDRVYQLAEATGVSMSRVVLQSLAKTMQPARGRAIQNLPAWPFVAGSCGEPAE